MFHLLSSGAALDRRGVSLRILRSGPLLERIFGFPCARLEISLRLLVTTFSFEAAIASDLTNLLLYLSLGSILLVSHNTSLVRVHFPV